MCEFTGWLSAGTADSLFSVLGYSVKNLRQSACKKEFRGFDLNSKISLTIKNQTGYASSTNVAGILKGSSRSEECIIYTAHWDHFGVGEKENGDSIYNGAVDNATSMAWAFCIGKAFASLKNRPARSVIILFPTAEEQGLLGSQYYTEHPVIGMNKTAACFNNDMMLPVGRMKDVMITGYGQSALDDIVREAAARQNRYIIKDPNSQTGMYFRSDHFSFARKGVPSSFTRGNVENREHGRAWTTKMEQDYLNNRYHKPADNYDPSTWDMSGIQEDAKLSFNAGYKVANSVTFPTWKAGSEFRNVKR